MNNYIGRRYITSNYPKHFLRTGSLLIIYTSRCEKQLLQLQVLKTSGNTGFVPNRSHQTLQTEAKLKNEEKPLLKIWFSVTYVLV